MKTFKTILAIIVILLAACGTDKGSDSSNEFLPEETTNPSEGSTPMSMALDTRDDLPECSDSNENQLVYIKDEATFYECDGGSWASIDIRGQDGEDGEDGEDYLNADNIWDDPVSGERWVIGATDVLWANIDCGSGYRLPTQDEGFAAAQHGLYQHAQNYGGDTDMWSSTMNPPGTLGRKIVRNMDSSYTSGTAAIASDTVGLYCIER